MDYREKLLSDVNLTEPQHGDTWGNWMYNAQTLALTYVPQNHDFDLEAPDILDLIFHFCAKTWMSAEDAGNLIFAISDLMYGDCPRERNAHRFGGHWPREPKWHNDPATEAQLQYLNSLQRQGKVASFPADISKRDAGILIDRAKAKSPGQVA